MKVSVKKLEKSQIEMDIIAEVGAFGAALDKAFDEVIKTVELKGFRKGKVPKNVYLQKYGEQSLYEKAIDITLNETYQKAVEEAKVYVLNTPEIDVDFESVGREKEFKYKAIVDVYPEIELGQYKQVEVKKQSTEVTKEDVDKDIEKTLKNKADLEVVEGRALQLGDTAIFDFEGFVDGVAFEGGKAENYSLEIGSGQFIPGFEDQMIGLASEVEKTVTVKFPDEYHASNLAGKNADFIVKVHEIKAKVLPTLNDEFVKELNIENINTVEDYKKHIETTLTNERQEAADNAFLDELLSTVCKNSKVELPQTLINEQVDYNVRQVETQAKQYGMSVDQLLQFNGTTLEQYKEMMLPGATRRALEEVVIGEIIKTENIVASAEEIEAKLDELAEMYGQDKEEVKKQINYSQFVYHVTFQKAVDFLKENAIIK